MRWGTIQGISWEKNTWTGTSHHQNAPISTTHSPVPTSILIPKPLNAMGLRIASSKFKTDGISVQIPDSQETKCHPTPLRLSSFPTTLSPTSLEVLIKCWRDTCVLCLTWGILGLGVTGALKSTYLYGPFLWFLPKPSSTPTMSLEVQPWNLQICSKVLVVPSCGHLL